ncbi:MAG: helix-turn-helix domain-containing protein [Planctomycetaceae bacterium]|jgi:transposase|nr:helix-turn-helix domain-containing protein [Planctomycetaceae bacterium]
MLRRAYTEQEKQTFHHLRFHHPNPRVRDRFEVLWLHANGECFPKIAKLVQISAASARKYFRLYEQGGVALVEMMDVYRPESALDEYRDVIIEEFKKHPPATTIEAAKRIKDLTGVDRKPRTVEDFMVKIGMSCKRVGAVPGKANLGERKQQCWILK